MPGQTFEAQAEHRFQSPNTTDYFPLTCTATNTSIDDTTQPPPCSAGSGKSARTASPMTFARWARRQHDGEPANKLKRRDHSSRNGLSRSGSIQKPQAQTGGAPQMTREEFEALPLAIQRKVCRNRFVSLFGLVIFETHGRGTRRVSYLSRWRA
jgi:hypothetical protein